MIHIKNNKKAFNFIKENSLINNKKIKKMCIEVK